MPTPACPSATDSSAAVRSSPAKLSPSDVWVDLAEAGGDLGRVRVVGGAQLVARGGARDQVGDRALVEHAAGADDRDAVAQLLDLAHQVAREQHGHALVGEPADQHAHVAHPRRVEPGGRLVEQQQPRRAQQRPGDAEALAHAVRVAADLVLGAAGEVDGVERLVDPVLGAVAVERRHQLEVAAPAQVRVEARRLDEARDAVEGASALEQRIAAEEARGALVGPDQPEQHPQRRRLAGPVGSEVAVDVAGAHGQVDVVDRRDVAVALDQPARLDRGRRHHSPLAAFSAATGGTEPSTM